VCGAKGLRGSSKAIRVFLADDHAIIRDGLRLILESEERISVVGEADNGREAVLQVQRLSPDVAIMDVAMPGLTGIDAAEQIRKASPLTKVLILSMYGNSEHIHHAFRAGAKGYLLKESAGKEVVDAVLNVSLGKRYVSQKIADVLVDVMLDPESVPARSPIESLSQREREILQLVVDGKSSAEIAGLLYISPKTVETYRSRLMEKLGIHDLPTLVRFAIQHGLTSSD